MWLKSTAKIVYDPPRPGMKRKTKWWCVANVDREITRYYRWWIMRTYHIKGLIPPSWDGHISVIRGEEPHDEYKHLWKKYDGQIVEFEYEHYPKKAKKDEFWIIEVRCPFLSNIRKEMNKPHDWPLHISIAKEQY